MKSWHRLACSAAVPLAVLWPSRASAHLVNTNVGEFYAGMLHPLTLAEHLLSTLALALLAIQCGKRAARTTLLTFPIALLAGTVAGSQLPPSVVWHVANLVALVGLGGMLTLGDHLHHIRPAALGVIALLTGLILGDRSGIDMAAAKVAARFIPGAACTGLIILALVAAWIPTADSRTGRTLRTLAGVGLMGAGLVLLGQFLTDAALPSVRGIKLPGQEELLAMLQVSELSVPLVIGTLLVVMVWGARHTQGPSPPHGHKHHHTHDHRHGHAHLPPGADGAPVTWRSILGLGISGGLLPCPSALVRLLTVISLNRAALGMVLVVAFSLGLAGVLTTVGLLFVKGSRVVQQLPRGSVWGALLPTASALVILMIGLWLTVEAVLRFQV